MRRVVVVLAFACAAAPLACKKKTPPAPSAPPAKDGEWSYEVRAGDGARELSAEAAFPRGTAATLSFEDGGERFAKDVEVSDGNAWRKVAASGATYATPECANGCRVRWTYALAEAAKSFDRAGIATSFGAASIVSPTSTWLIHPDATPALYRVHVTTAPGTLFLAGLPLAKDAVDTYEVARTSMDFAPYAALGAWRSAVVPIGDARITLAIAPNALPLGDDAITRWLGDQARGVGTYFGGFPASRLLFIVVPDRGGGVDGMTLGGGGHSVLLRLGAQLTETKAREAWVVAHELVHVCSPSLGHPHQWMEEGLATYVEPIIRARAKWIDADSVWRDLMRDGPKGAPEPGDQGLERTHTWGRTYWGGAIFWLLADVRIRERTAGARSLDDALRAIAQAGGTVAQTWTVERYVAAADAATGVPVVRELFDAMAFAPAPVDLPALWKRLGVELRGDSVVYDDKAPLAAVRRAITAPR